MKRLGMSEVLALHALVGMGAVSLLFSLVFPDGRSPIESWQEQLRLMMAGLGRFPFPSRWYVAAAVASLAIIPAVAAPGRSSSMKGSVESAGSHVFFAAASTPSFYLALCRVLDSDLRAGMSSYARIMVWSFVPTAPTLWPVLGAEMAASFFSESLLQQIGLHAQIGKHPFQSAVLLLKSLHLAHH